MNTNNNLYTIIYTTIIVVVVAALLAFVSQSLKSKQDANEKAETISQMLTAAQYGSKAELDKLPNSAKLEKYEAELQEAFVVNLSGDKGKVLEGIEVYGPKALKRQNYNIKGGPNKTGEPELPVFIFRNGSTVVPIYGAGLWGPVWGYIAFEADGVTIKGAYFDHESETAGLGAKIKDDPDFQAEFVGEKIDWNNVDLSVPIDWDKVNVFEIVKGGAPKQADGSSLVDGKIDAITGATMTSQGLDAAIDTWLAAYAAYFGGNAPVISSEVSPVISSEVEKSNVEEVSL
jgi:Na+-transporting NADH:ubiquinone oxidoreductase subunit C